MATQNLCPECGKEMDWENGEWHANITPDGRPQGSKASQWKAGYHNGRAMIECLEIMKSWKWKD